MIQLFKCALLQKGEKSELVFKQVYYMGVFLLSHNSRSSETFIGSSCNLKPDGALILLLRAYSLLMTLHACWISSGTISHHAFQILHIIYQMHGWITRYRGRSPWFNSSNVHCLKRKFLTMHIFRWSSSISCSQIPQNQYIHFIYLYPLKT